MSSTVYLLTEILSNSKTPVNQITFYKPQRQLSQVLKTPSIIVKHTAGGLEKWKKKNKHTHKRDCVWAKNVK